MTLHYRKRFSFGPIRVNVTKTGVSSVALKIGPFTYNFKRRKLTTNLPGGAYHTKQL